MSMEKLQSLVWQKARLPTQYAKLNANFYVCDSADECSLLIESCTEAVHSRSETLFRVIKEANRVEENIPGVPIKLYRYEGPPEVQLWHVVPCKLEDTVNFSRFFKFPASDELPDADAAFGAAKAIILEVNQKKPLAIDQIDAGFLSLRLVKPSDKLTKEEVTGIREYNKRHFGAPLSKAEERDQLRNWINKGFFTLGGI